MAHPEAVTDADFEEKVVKSKTPVLVDFWAEWCAPCRMIAPMVEELAGEYEGKLNVVKVDVDASPDTSVKYGIRSIPTLLIFKNGKIAEQVIGAVPKSVLKRRVDSALA